MGEAFLGEPLSLRGDIFCAIPERSSAILLSRLLNFLRSFFAPEPTTALLGSLARGDDAADEDRVSDMGSSASSAGSSGSSMDWDDSVAMPPVLSLGGVLTKGGRIDIGEAGSSHPNASVSASTTFPEKASAVGGTGCLDTCSLSGVT